MRSHSSVDSMHAGALCQACPRHEQDRKVLHGVDVTGSPSFRHPSVMRAVDFASGGMPLSRLACCRAFDAPSPRGAQGAAAKDGRALREPLY